MYVSVQVFYYYLLSICMCMLNKVRETSTTIFFFFFFTQWACGSMAPTHICIAHLSRLPLSFSSGKILIKIYIFLYIILSTACMCSVNGIWMAETTLYVEKNRFTALHMNFLFFLFYYQCKSYLQLAFYQNASLIFITFSQHAVATPRSGNTWT